MQLTSEKVKYLTSKSVEKENGVYYLHTFLSEDDTLTFYSPNPVNLKQLQECNLVIKCSAYQGKNNFKLIEVCNG